MKPDYNYIIKVENIRMTNISYKKGKIKVGESWRYKFDREKIYGVTTYKTMDNDMLFDGV